MNDDDRYMDLLTNLKAVELVVKGLFTKWALEAPDPRASAFRMIEAMIGSLREIRLGDTPEEARAMDSIEDHLRGFLRNVDVRLAAMELEKK
jgi:hypothetical protein